jgi:hypothetical protein
VNVDQGHPSTDHEGLNNMSVIQDRPTKRPRRAAPTAVPYEAARADEAVEDLADASVADASAADANAAELSARTFEWIAADGTSELVPEPVMALEPGIALGPQTWLEPDAVMAPESVIRPEPEPETEPEPVIALGPQTLLEPDAVIAPESMIWHEPGAVIALGRQTWLEPETEPEPETGLESLTLELMVAASAHIEANAAVAPGGAAVRPAAITPIVSFAPTPPIAKQIVPRSMIAQGPRTNTTPSATERRQRAIIVSLIMLLVWVYLGRSRFRA